MDKKTVIIIFLVALVAFYSGYALGTAITIKWVINGFYSLLEAKKIDIDISRDMLYYGVMQYKNNIGECLFITQTKNASLHYD